ncbi:Sec-independent protein translocase protein TatB [Neorhizobium sp. DT-125]|uniref:Sec-independent protein translocase protein TatB n=1 Tax=Neorhizobium sp. DT-125 TaxID=3396163 RepID=UPI003F1A6C06
MFDIGWTELLVIAIVLIVVVGPKDLPPMLRAFGKMTANLRKMAGEFRTQFDEALRESELDDVRKTISDAQRLNPTNALREAINPLRQMGQEIKADLQKATQVPTPAVAEADAEAQQAIEGTQSAEPVPEVPANFPSPSVTLPSTPPPVSAPAPAPAQSVPAVQAAAAPVAVAEKPKPVRKAPARAKPVAEAAGAAAEKPKRSRAAKPAPATKAAEEAAVKVPARKRAPKKPDTPKDDA